MKRILLIFCAIIIGSSQAFCAPLRFGERLCRDPDYFCINVKAHESWSSLFANPTERDLIRRINRMNVRLRPGMVLAVPKNLDRLTIYDLAPFPRYIRSEGEKSLYVSQEKLAWGAYNEEGELLWWGPISSGNEHCRGVSGGCATPPGEFRMVRKQDIDCVSTAFPRRVDGNNGGALMPFCMHFFRGYALHGSLEVPGYRASHGCVRLFIEDAQWLNEEFIDLPGQGQKGTRIIID